MQTCRACSDDKDEEDFHWKIKRLGIRQSVCKSCRSQDRKSNPEYYGKQDAKRYAKDPERERARSAAHKTTHREQGKRQSASWWANNPDKKLHYRLKYKGISRERYDELVAAQKGRCAACLTDDPGKGCTRFCIDHDHSCCPGEKTCGDCVRGLLCQGCNKALGSVRDVPDTLRALAEYLERTRK